MLFEIKNDTKEKKDEKVAIEISHLKLELWAKVQFLFLLLLINELSTSFKSTITDSGSTANYNSLHIERLWFFGVDTSNKMTWKRHKS